MNVTPSRTLQSKSHVYGVVSNSFTGGNEPLLTSRPKLSEQAHLKPEAFVDANEAAEFLKLNSKTVLRLAREGILPAHPLTGIHRRHWRFLKSELDDWARGKVNSACDPCQDFRRI